MFSAERGTRAGITHHKPGLLAVGTVLLAVGAGTADMEEDTEDVGWTTTGVGTDVELGLAGGIFE